MGNTISSAKCEPHGSGELIKVLELSQHYPHYKSIVTMKPKLLSNLSQNSPWCI